MVEVSINNLNLELIVSRGFVTIIIVSYMHQHQESAVDYEKHNSIRC